MEEESILMLAHHTSLPPVLKVWMLGWGARMSQSLRADVCQKRATKEQKRPTDIAIPAVCISVKRDLL